VVDTSSSVCGDVRFEGFGASPYSIGVIDRIVADL
jgi:hypothetical protein